MAAPKLAPGDVFWLSSTGGDDNPGNRHRFVCLAVNADGSDYLVVPICTPQPQSDRTCELSPADYPPLSHRSYAAYHLMREISCKVLDVAAFGGHFKSQQALTVDALLKVREGALQSPEAKPRMQTYLKTHGGM